MIRNLFGNVTVFNKLFTLQENNVFNIESAPLVSEEVKDLSEFLISNYKGKNSEVVLVKAFSFQPNINGFEVIVKERKAEIEAGILKIKELTGAKEVKFLVSKADKNLDASLSQLGQVVKVNPLDEFYEDRLVQKALGGGKNALIEDLSKVVYLGQTIKEDNLQLYIPVYGSAVKGNKVISVNEGTSLEVIFNALDGDKAKLRKIVVGGSLNGELKYDLSEKVDINTKSILFLTDKDSPSENSTSCIRCSKCLRACPEGLNPIKLMDLWKRKEKVEFLKFGGEKCIECGMCSYVCPSNLELTQSIKTAKKYIGK